MILVYGILADGMIELMCARLNDMGYEYLFVDELQIPARFHLNWSTRGNRVSGNISSRSSRLTWRTSRAYMRDMFHIGMGRSATGLATARKNSPMPNIKPLRCSCWTACPALWSTG